MTRYYPWTLTVAFLSLSISADCQSPEPVDLCKVLHHPADFKGQILSIHGNFEKGIEFTDISVASCDRSLPIRFTDAGLNDAGVKAILAVYYCPPFEADGKRMSADFTGRFESRPGKKPEWTLHVDRASHVHIEVDSCGAS